MVRIGKVAGDLVDKTKPVADRPAKKAGGFCIEPEKRAGSLGMGQDQVTGARGSVLLRGPRREIQISQLRM